MPNKMIIDASHPEETRVVVLKGEKVEEFDFESVSKKPLRGNIYLAKVTRVEPSLQAAFVDYGGNRHGFLAFSEIHPDYYQIPVADRRALLEEEAASHRDEEEATDERKSRRRQRGHGQSRSRGPRDPSVSGAANGHGEPSHSGEPADDQPALVQFAPSEAPQPATHTWSDAAPADHGQGDHGLDIHAEDDHLHEAGAHDGHDHEGQTPAAAHAGEAAAEAAPYVAPAPHDGHHEVTEVPHRADEEEAEPVEHIGGDAMDETPRRAIRGRRQYKIQEVIKRRQVLLVQVVKEERGNKGAALTTYLSLAGRYCVLMPNTARGGGISRKITNNQDRDRLRDIADALEVPDGMGVILRTAGAARPLPDIRRDFEYLLRMWETVREMTLASSAPMLVYEEGSLIKRAIRDLYGRDVEEIVVAGDAGFKEARDFMKLLMPSHADSVRLYKDTQPIFAKSGVEAQLDAMFSNQVTLKSGGYIVINQTEALVAIDVNSGRSTREHNIEDTALRTNMEAADEIARQLRLRDLAGLIVVDFIDMEEMRNNRSVERRMKDALKNDRARIQVGRISHFGLLEMSRQRIRSGVIEGSTVQCPHCTGSGVVRSTPSVALHVLRVIEDALIRDSRHDVLLRARTPVALYILNQKRAHLRDLEERFGVAVLIEADDSLTGAANHSIERGEPTAPAREAPRLAAQAFAPEALMDDEGEGHQETHEAEALGAAESEAFEAEGEEGAPQPEGAENADGTRRRRRRRRRRGGEGAEREAAPRHANSGPQAADGEEGEAPLGGEAEPVGDAQPMQEGEAEGQGEGRSRRRRRPRRGRFGKSEFGQDDAAPATAGEEPHEGGEAAAEPIGAHSASAEPAAPMAPARAAVEPAEMAASHRIPAEPVGFMASGQVAADPAEMGASYREPAAPVAARPRPAEPAHAVAAPAVYSPPAVEDPNRPRRSGWWQKAKSTLMGE